MIQDNTAKWKAKKLSSLKTSGGIPVGFEYISMNPNVPQGSLPMFGGVYDRKVYADLWAWVQEQSGYLITDSEWQSYFKSNDGNVPFYSKGDGSTTFRVPSISCWVKGADGIEEVSSYYKDEVNKNTITVSAGAHTHKPSQPSGYTNHNFVTVADTPSSASTARRQVVTSSTTGIYTITYSNTASDYVGSNDMGDVPTTASSGAHTHTINGGEETRPKTLVGMWLVKAYGTITNIGNVETSDILQAVDNSKITLAVW
jgi:hypothetical protein